MMDHTLDGLEGTFPHMDDSRVGSPDRKMHLHHLEAFFAALAANGLAINLDKCVFAVPTLEFLGQDRPRQSIPLPQSNHPPLQDIKHSQCFLGTVNFYCCFLPNCAQVLRPLADLLKGGGAKNIGVD
jgi:hypothetical protein